MTQAGVVGSSIQFSSQFVPQLHGLAKTRCLFHHFSSAVYIVLSTFDYTIFPPSNSHFAPLLTEGRAFSTTTPLFSTTARALATGRARGVGRVLISLSEIPSRRFSATRAGGACVREHTQLRHGPDRELGEIAGKGTICRYSTSTKAGITATKLRSSTATAGTQSNDYDMADDFQDAADRIEDHVLGGGAGRGGKNRRGGGGGRRGGGGGGAGGSSRQVQISKALSTLLRHQAQNAGVQLDSEGFAPLDRVMQWPRLRSLNPTVAEIKDEVATNAKQRFSMKPNPDESVSSTTSKDDAAHWVIRANQGHSIAIASEALHAPITFATGNIPDVVVHGTYFAFWPAIVSAGGLKKMGRTHVHFGTGIPGDDGGGTGQVHNVEDEEEGAVQNKPKVISGMRADAEVLIFVDVERALRDSEASSGSQTADEEAGGEIKWWMSENNVVLTEGNAEGLVPLKYFKEVRGRRQGVGLLWKDGEKVADLPDGIVARVPQGKDRGGGGERGGRGGRRGGRGRGRGS
ncbi:KptA family-domain-containing protein [Xylaria flabelliformis]|nr:KptA family-domain-containing protein [Xylaria flabelliformis]